MAYIKKTERYYIDSTIIIATIVAHNLTKNKVAKSMGIDSSILTRVLKRGYYTHRIANKPIQKVIEYLLSLNEHRPIHTSGRPNERVSPLEEVPKIPGDKQ